MATKKQVNDLENVVLALEERQEKMEEEHAMLKQMLSMQSVLIENLQMMVKMISTNSASQNNTSTAHTAYRVMHIGGDDHNNSTVIEQDGGEITHNSDNQTSNSIDVKRQSKKNSTQNNSITDIRHRMSRVA